MASCLGSIPKLPNDLCQSDVSLKPSLKGISMLVLGRQTNERITIMDSGNKIIEIIVVRTQRGQVRLGIKADKARFRVLRNELIERDNAERAVA